MFKPGRPTSQILLLLIKYRAKSIGQGGNHGYGGGDKGEHHHHDDDGLLGCFPGHGQQPRRSKKRKPHHARPRHRSQNRQTHQRDHSRIYASQEDRFGFKEQQKRQRNNHQQAQGQVVRIGIFFLAIADQPPPLIEHAGDIVIDGNERNNCGADHDHTNQRPQLAARCDDVGHQQNKQQGLDHTLGKDPPTSAWPCRKRDSHDQYRDEQQQEIGFYSKLHPRTALTKVAPDNRHQC